MRSDFTGDLSKRVKCKRCGDSHFKRERLPGTCLACDIGDRWQRGQSVESIAVGLDLPVFLVRKTVEG